MQEEEVMDRALNEVVDMAITETITVSLEIHTRQERAC